MCRAYEIWGGLEVRKRPNISGYVLSHFAKCFTYTLLTKQPFEIGVTVSVLQIRKLKREVKYLAQGYTDIM